jgi:hypothetical protein
MSLQIQSLSSPFAYTVKKLRFPLKMVTPNLVVKVSIKGCVKKNIVYVTEQVSDKYPDSTMHKEFES